MVVSLESVMEGGRLLGDRRRSFSGREGAGGAEADDHPANSGACAETRISALKRSEHCCLKNWRLEVSGEVFRMSAMRSQLGPNAR